MKKICNLSYDKFVTNGEVKEGLPLHENNLLVYYPLEGDTYNIVPEVKIYVENNQLIKKGIKSENAINIVGATYENNMIKLNGTNSSYIAINKEIFNSHKNYKIEIEYMSTKSNKEECLLFLGDKDSVNEYYNIWNNGTTQSLSLRRMNGNEKISIDISNICESIPGKINKLTLYSNNNSFFTSYVNDNYNKVYYNSKETKPTTIYPITNDNYFNGYIKSITINTYDDLHTGDNKVEVNDCGFVSHAGAINVNSESVAYNVYWTLGKNLFFHKTNKTLYGMPIYRIVIKPDTEELLNNLKGQWSVGIQSSDKISLNANQDACSYLLYRPLTFKDSVKVNGGSTNSIQWSTKKPVDLKNGWKLVYKNRIESSKNENQADWCYWTFFSDDIKLNEELVIECTSVIVLKDTQIPAGLSFKSLENKLENKIIASPKIINDNINEFSLSYEWIFLSHTSDYDWPRHLWLSNYPGDTPKTDWIALYYNGKGWNDKNVCITEYTSKESSIRNSSGSIHEFKKYLGHTLKVILTYNKKAKEIKGILYNKTTNEILNKFEHGNVIFNEFNNLSINENTNDIMKNFAIYNKSFTLEEMKSMCRKDFKIMEDGSFNIDYLKEFDFLSYKDSYYLPLDYSPLSECKRLNCVQNDINLFNKNTIVDGFVYDDGKIYPSLNDDFTSDFIPIKDNKFYIFNISNCTKQNTPAVAWYDENKKFIIREIQYYTGNCISYFLSPSRAKYAKITSRWKNEVSISFKEENANNIEYVYEDGGLNVGKIIYKAHKNLTPNYRGNPINYSLSWDTNLHNDALDYPDWSNGFNQGVLNHEIGYHAKWVNEGPTRNSCIKFINYNSNYNKPNIWIAIATVLTNFFKEAKVTIGDKIQICFKAKCLNDSSIKVGIYRDKKSNGKPDFYQLPEVYLSNSWKNYCVEITVDNDWKMDGEQALYVYGYEGKEDICWASNFHITINAPNYITSDMLEGNENEDLTYNLTDDINMDWSKPWHISFWKKPISKDSVNNFNLFSLGVFDNKNLNKGYLSAGYANNGYVFMDYIDCFFSVEENKFFNQWAYVTIDYNGSNIILRYRGEHFYFEKTSSGGINRKDYFKHPDQKADLFLGSYRGISNNSTIKDLLIIKNKCLSKEEEDKIFQTLMKYDYTLKNRINIYEEKILTEEMFVSDENHQNLQTENGQDILI